MSRFIAIANQKGGVGKTTTTVNLGASLAELGQRVLVLDMDPQGNASSGFGVAANTLNRGIYEVLMGYIPIEEAVHSQVSPGVDLLPSGQRLIGVEVELVATLARERVLEKWLAPLRDKYDILLADCPPSLGLLTVNTLTAADTVLVPIQCEYYALEGLTQLLNTIRLIQQALNPRLDIEGILLTMFDARLNLSREVADEARKFFPGKVYDTVIPRNVRLSEAPSFGKPVIQYDRECAGAQFYLRLAGEVLDRRDGLPVVAAAEETVETVHAEELVEAVHVEEAMTAPPVEEADQVAPVEEVVHPAPVEEAEEVHVEEVVQPAPAEQPIAVLAVEELPQAQVEHATPPVAVEELIETAAVLPVEIEPATEPTLEPVQAFEVELVPAPTQALEIEPTQPALEEEPLTEVVAVEAPHIAVEEPAEAVEAPTESAEEPTEAVEAPTESVEAPTEVVPSEPPAFDPPQGLTLVDQEDAAADLPGVIAQEEPAEQPTASPDAITEQEVAQREELVSHE